MPKKNSARRLQTISDDLDAGRQIDAVTVREILRWFDAQRRGLWITNDIRRLLKAHNLTTKPDFEGAYIDELISFARPEVTKKSNRALLEATVLPDPTYRIGRLESANRRPVSVAPDHTLEKAVTLMLSHDFSQLPVMTNDRTVKGMIGWNSIGSRLALNRDSKFVRDYMDPHNEISADTSLFAAIDKIVECEYVLIRDSKQKISGIVTTTDLSVQFKQLGEPFLLVGEVENYVRRMIQDKFSKEELSEAKDPADIGREVENASDLTFGEYRRLLEDQKRWGKLNLAIDRVEFVDRLDVVRRIRNDIMHFDPDGIPDEDIEILHYFVEFLQRLANIRVI